MSYCDFNPRLFKQFVSKGAKIIPAQADDWEMVPTSYVKIGGFSLKSAKLKQEVADIDLMRFLKFCKMENLVIEGLKLKGTFIVGNDRSVYTEKTYKQWKDKFESRTENIIDKKDYIVGHKYKTPCGAELIYLGYKYIAKIKSSSFRNGEYDEYTKVQKKYIVISDDGVKDDYYKKSNYYTTELKQKFTVDLGLQLSTEEIKEIFKYHLINNTDIVCFENSIPKDPKYGLVECEVLPSGYSDFYSGALVVSALNETYSTEKLYGTNNLRKVNGKFELTYREYEFNLETMSKMYSHQYNNNTPTKVTKMYRVGLV